MPESFVQRGGTKTWVAHQKYDKTGRVCACEKCIHYRLKKPWCNHPRHARFKKWAIKWLYINFYDGKLPFCKLFKKWHHECGDPDTNYDFTREVWWIGCDYAKSINKEDRT